MVTLHKINIFKTLYRTEHLKISEKVILEPAVKIKPICRFLVMILIKFAHDHFWAVLHSCPLWRSSLFLMYIFHINTSCVSPNINYLLSCNSQYLFQSHVSVVGLLDWVKTQHKLVVLILWSGATEALQNNEMMSAS